MNVVVKMARALQKAKISVKEIDNEQRIAEKTFTFLHQGRKIPLTLRAVSSVNEYESRMEMIVWETPKCISGKTMELDNIAELFPELDLSNPRIEREIERIKRRAKLAPTMFSEDGIIKTNYSLLYPDE